MIIILTDSDNGNINDNVINNKNHHLISLHQLSSERGHHWKVQEKHRPRAGHNFRRDLQQDSGWCGCPVFCFCVFGACKWMLSKEEHARSTVNIVDCCRYECSSWQDIYIYIFKYTIYIYIFVVYETGLQKYMQQQEMGINRLGSLFCMLTWHSHSVLHTSICQ